MTVKCKKIFLYIVSILSNNKEEDIMKAAKKIIKHCLGKEVYKKFTF